MRRPLIGLLELVAIVGYRHKSIDASRIFANMQDAESETQKSTAHARLELGEGGQISVEEVHASEPLHMRARAMRMHDVEFAHLSPQQASSCRRQAQEAQANEDKREQGKGKHSKKRSGKKEPKTETSEPSSPSITNSDKTKKATSSMFSIFKSKRGKSKSLKDDGTETDFLQPSETISPTRISGNMCVQFDLDLWAISGFAFPGLIGVGILGDIHQIPDTGCYGWTNELYLQLSIYFPMLSKVFRVSFVFIGTLIVTEQPLDAAKDELTWELPSGYDTSKCHTSDPFKLIHKSIKQGWSFMKTHILTTKLQDPEAQIRQRIKDAAAEIAEFDVYRTLLRPGNEKWISQYARKPNNYNGALNSENVTSNKYKGTAHIKGTLLGYNLVFQVDPPALSTNPELEAMRLIIWQDYGAFVHTETEKWVDPSTTAKWNYQVRLGVPLLGQVELKDKAGQTYLAPFKLTPDTYFDYEVSFRDIEKRLPAVLAVTSLNIEWESESCVEKANEKASVEVQFKTGQTWEKATWTASEFGSGFPWGVHVEEQSVLLSNELSTYIWQDKPLINMQQLDKNELASLLLFGSEHSSRVSSIFEESVDELEDITKLESLQSSSSPYPVVKAIEPAVIEHFIAQVLYASKNTLVTEAICDCDSSQRTECSCEKLQNLLRGIVERLPSVVVQSINQAKASSQSSSVNATKRAMKQAGDMFKEQDVDFDDIEHPSAVPLRRSATEETSSELEWHNYGGRRLSSRQCCKIGSDLVKTSLDECKAACQEHRDTDHGAACRGHEEKTKQGCNVAQFQEDQAGLCTLWACWAWDLFPPQAGMKLAALMPRDAAKTATDAEIVSNLPGALLREAIKRMNAGEEKLSESLAGAASLNSAGRIWRAKVELKFVQPMKTALTNCSNPDERCKKTMTFLRRPWLLGIVRKTLLRDTKWLEAEHLQSILDDGSAEQKSVDQVMRVKVLSVKSQNLKANKAVTISRKRMGGDRWDEAVQFFWQGSDYLCKGKVQMGLAWQPAVQARYFKRPKLAPVAEAYFAAYERFSAKVQPYAQQVLERLVPHERGWFEGVTQVLPYGTTDGRFLHRHLKKSEQDKLKIHEGDLATDSAVYNFPKAIETSQHKDTPRFAFNVGLAVGNLYLRALGDFQALFFLHFANHPDWDGRCESLPARFNLFYEASHKGGPGTSYRSNYGYAETKFSGPDKESSLPTRRSGDTLSEQGAKLTKEDERLILDWHWISKPHWLAKATRRAAFWTNAVPHGKDGWAKPDIAGTSAKVWPHVWCELVQGSWKKDESKIVQKHLKAEEGSSLQSLKEMFETDAELREFAGMTEKTKYEKTFEKIFEFQSHELKQPMSSCTETIALWQDGVSANDKLQKKWETSKAASQKIMDFLDGLKDIARDDIANAKSDSEPDKVESEAANSEENQLDTLDDTMVDVERMRTQELTDVRGMSAAALELWNSHQEEDARHAQASVQAKYRFNQFVAQVEVSVSEKDAMWAEVHGQLDRLFKDYPRSQKENLQKRSAETIRREIVFAGPLLKGIIQLQRRIIAEFRLLQVCIDLAARPQKLQEARFWPWAKERQDDERFAPVLRHLKDADFAGLASDGIDMFFDEACRVPLDFEAGQTLGDTLQEPRSECERFLMHTALFTIFPAFADKALTLFKELQSDLAALLEAPSLGKVEPMLQKVRDFLTTLQDGLDDDFFTGFGYRSDGSLFGELWAPLADATTKIEANLEDRKVERKSWIAESVRERNRLKHKRRFRVRQPDPPKPEVPTLVEGCVCEDKWTAWVWWKLPHWYHYEGCAEIPKHNSVAGRLSDFDISEWKGFCRTREAVRTLTNCTTKFAACDPAVTEDTRPGYAIWRKSDVGRRSIVTLPLLRMDFSAHFDVRNARADFCTPNFAPLLFDVTWYWSAFNWISWELRRSVCMGLRIHPPGVFVYFIHCWHRDPKKDDEVTESRFTELQIIGGFYLMSYYNNLGTGDGDMFQTWFGGGEDSWASTTAAKGFPGVFAQNQIWSSEYGLSEYTGMTQDASGFGYLNTNDVVASPVAKFLGIIAEVASVYATSKAEAAFQKSGEEELGASGKKPSQKHLAKAIVWGMGRTLWEILKLYKVIPTEWGGLEILKNIASVTKAVTIGNVDLSPWRHEHDIILTMRYSKTRRSHTRPVKALVDRLSSRQLQTMFQKSEELGGPTETLWNEWHGLAGHGAKSLNKLSRKTLQQLINKCYEDRPDSDVFWLFEGCQSPPRWYEVQKLESQLPVYAFYNKKDSAWMKPPFDPAESEELLLIRVAPDWYAEATLAVDEPRYMPAKYVEKKLLKVAADTKKRNVTRPEIHKLLDTAARPTLLCWAERVNNNHPQLLEDIISSTEVDVSFFEDSYGRDFFNSNWDKIKDELSAERWEQFVRVLSRGKGSRFKLDPLAEKERGIFRASSLDVSLTLQFRIGLSFIRIPQILQVQPYMQIALSWDVKQIINAIKARFTKKSQVQKNVELVEWKNRRKNCTKCIEQGMAFCDRRAAAGAMLKSGYDADMDECVVKSLENKAACHNFEWRSTEAGEVFRKDICPCFNSVDGGQVWPWWITDVSHCQELEWPGSAEEAARRQQKKIQVNLGFRQRKILRLSDTVDIEVDNTRGCKQGYRCCSGNLKTGEEVLRCVKVSKCKYYTEKLNGTLAGDWSHMRQEWRCASSSANFQDHHEAEPVKGWFR